MNRIGDDMLDEASEYGNIADSIGVVLRGKRRKHSNQGRYILQHQDEVICKLQIELREGTFRLKGYHEMLVTDGPKVRRVQSVSLYAMLKHCNGRHLFKVLTGKTMIEFKEVGMTYKADDGKKHFNGEPMKLSRLVNTHIIIKDFETDVKTKNGLRTLVSFEKEDGTLGKYFTEDKQQLYFLQQFRDKGLMPFRTEIQLEHYGDGKIRYIFT